MPYEDIIDSLIKGGPMLSGSLTLLVAALIALFLVFIINGMFGVLVSLLKETNKQTELTREVIIKIDKRMSIVEDRVNDLANQQKDDIKRMTALLTNKFDESDKKLGDIINLFADNLKPVIVKIETLSGSINDLENQVLRTYHDFIEEISANYKKGKTNEEEKPNASPTNTAG